MDTKTAVPTQSRDTELACKFMELVSRAYATKKMVADYASELMVTPNYLNQIVKRVSGFPASHHIQQYLIMEAKRQAIQSCRSMKEIAYDLGFEDLAHFSKFFKNKSGTNFSSFKKSRQLVSA
jgi:YesN/AraC family two-component response regulator